MAYGDGSFIFSTLVLSNENRLLAFFMQEEAPILKKVGEDVTIMQYLQSNF